MTGARSAAPSRRAAGAGGRTGRAGAGDRVYAVTPSPLGDLVVVADGEALTGLWFLAEHRWFDGIDDRWRRDPVPLAGVTEQLAAYFAGELRRFDVPLAPDGTAFQRRVWQALTAIPYGTTTSYGALAQGLGRPGSARAVGAANGRNPISVVVPCHRVVGATGDLVGYGGGLETKRRLLALESGQRSLMA